MASRFRTVLVVLVGIAIIAVVGDYAVAGSAILNPRAVLGLMLLLAAALSFLARQLDFASDFAAISPFFYRPSPAAADSVAASNDRAAELPRAGVVFHDRNAGARYR